MLSTAHLRPGTFLAVCLLAGIFSTGTVTGAAAPKGNEACDEALRTCTMKFAAMVGSEDTKGDVCAAYHGYAKCIEDLTWGCLEVAEMNTLLANIASSLQSVGVTCDEPSPDSVEPRAEPEPVPEGTYTEPVAELSACEYALQTCGLEYLNNVFIANTNSMDAFCPLFNQLLDCYLKAPCERNETTAMVREQVDSLIKQSGIEIDCEIKYPELVTVPPTAEGTPEVTEVTLPSPEPERDLQEGGGSEGQVSGGSDGDDEEEEVIDDEDDIGDEGEDEEGDDVEDDDDEENGNDEGGEVEGQDGMSEEEEEEDDDDDDEEVEDGGDEGEEEGSENENDDDDDEEDGREEEAQEEEGEQEDEDDDEEEEGEEGEVGEAKQEATRGADRDSAPSTLAPGYTATILASVLFTYLSLVILH